MSGKSPNIQLDALLNEARWTGQDLAHAVNALAAAQNHPFSYDRTSVAHWRAGTQPRPPARLLIVQAFSSRLNRRVSLEEAGLTRLPAACGESFPTRSSPLERLVALARSEHDPQRRSALLMSPLEVPTAPRGTPLAVFADETESGPQQYYLAAGAEAFWRLREQYGGVRGRAAVASLISDGLIRTDASGKERGSRTEQHVAARLAYVLGHMTYDAGYNGLAQRYFHLAADLAESSGTRSIRAIALRSLGNLYLTSGHPVWGHQFTRAAINAAGHEVPGSVLSYLHSQLAVTHALLGDRRSAHQNLERAEIFFLSGNGGNDSFRSYPRSALDFQHSRVWSAQGDERQAAAHLEDASRNRLPGHNRADVLARVAHARVLVSLGRIDEAVSQAEKALAGTRLAESHQTDIELTALARELTSTSNYPPVRQVQRLLRAVLGARKSTCARCATHPP